MMKRHLLVITILSLLLPHIAKANSPADTLSVSTSSVYNPRWQSFAVGGAVVAASTLMIDNDWLQKRQRGLRKLLGGEKGHRIEIDNYTQYAPMVAVYGLNLCGVKGRHGVLDRSVLLAMSAFTMAAVVNGMKYTLREMRPDTSRRNSFPSGHTATAFMGAEFLFQEYKDVSPWIGYSGYAVATATALMRVYNNRHWINDLTAGAAIGIMSTKFAYWLYPKLFHESTNRNGVQWATYPTLTDEGTPCLSLAVTF